MTNIQKYKKYTKVASIWNIRNIWNVIWTTLMTWHLFHTHIKICKNRQFDLPHLPPKSGYRVNTTKTEVMALNINNPTPIKLGDKDLKYVDRLEVY